MRVLAAGLMVLAVAAPAAGARAGLPSVASGHRPGPDALYAPPPRVPQLENTGVWTAPPILISGASAYREGEFLYQDHLLDDRGAAGAPDPRDPHGPGDFLYSPKAGTLTYPTDPVYAHNAADLVELRVKPLPGATALRVTLNTLIDPERTAFTVAIGTSETPRPWPHAAGVSSPAELFLTVHGSAAELVDADSGRQLTPVPTATVDRERRQVEVRIPHAAWNPGRGTVRLAAGVGLWDPQGGGYLPPGEEASATRPGGAAPSAAALFNVAFRYEEPLPDIDQLPTYTMVDAAAGSAVQAAWWRERAQADALRSGDISPFFAEVDFGRLTDRVRDETRVPKDGPMNRILGSRHATGQGVDHTKVCFDISAGFAAGARCEGRIQGQLQPYAIYVPRKPAPARGYGLTLLLHSLSANHNQYADSDNQSQLGERGAGTIVVTPSGRGPDGFYAGLAETDTFEVWADVARHYDLDPDWAVTTGYSMGGFGTFRLLARFPDLFARGFATVAVPGSADDQVASLRNTPVAVWNAAGDELVHVSETEEMVKRLTDAGLRYVVQLYLTADHLTLATNDEYGPAAAWLGDHRVDRDPPRVTYVVDPREDNAAGQVVADHAYWLSGLRLRDPAKAPTGTIDVVSLGFGAGDPKVEPVARSAGTLDGGTHGPKPYDQRTQDWDAAPAAARADRLVVTATNVAAATIDTRRARVGCAPQIELKGEPVALTLACPPPSARRERCRPTVALRLPRVKGRRIVSVRARYGTRTVKRVRGRDLRRVVVRRPTRRAFKLRLALRTSDGRTITVHRRVRACAG